MLCSLERNERIIQALSLPVRGSVPPVGSMTGDTVDEFVMSQVLRTLVGITARGARSADQCQADRVVIRLVGPVLAIGQHRRAELATHVSQVDPLV